MVNYPAMPYTRLSRWLLDQIGRDKPLKSGRDLALKAGYTQNTVNEIIERGSCNPKTLRQLAKTLGVNPVKAFIAAEWLPEETVTGELPLEQEGWLAMWTELDQEGREYAVSAIQGILQLQRQRM